MPKCRICELELKCGKEKPNTSNMIHYLEHHSTQAKEKKAFYLGIKSCQRKEVWK